jgi:hypothetical protein
MSNGIALGSIIAAVINIHAMRKTASLVSASAAKGPWCGGADGVVLER